MRTVSRSTSRVVPATSATIARASPARALSNELLPAFGGPSSTACRPSRRRRPRSAWSIKACRSTTRASRSARTAPMPRVSIGSSTKSMAASTCTRRRSRVAAMASTRCENTPSSDRRAARAARRSAAAIRSATASAWTRSSLPLRKARWLNSPGPAWRAPSSQQRSTSRRSSTGLPWACSSTTSSPVKLCGPGNASTRPSSITSPAASVKVARRARRGSSDCPHRCRAICKACGPDSRTMPTPPAPGAVAIAAMVSLPGPVFITLPSSMAKTRH